jgi:hypothetical protein
MLNGVIYNKIVCTLVANILNEQSGMADQGWCPCSVFERRLATPYCKNINVLRDVTQDFGIWQTLDGGTNGKWTRYLELRNVRSLTCRCGSLKTIADCTLGSVGVQGKVGTEQADDCQHCAG